MGSLRMNLTLHLGHSALKIGLREETLALGPKEMF
jgi:hypothetical protein